MKLRFYSYTQDYFVQKSCYTLLLLALLYIASPQAVHAKLQSKDFADKRISLKLNKVSVPKGLTALEEKSFISINFSPAIFADTKPVSLEVHEMPLINVLKLILADTRVTYKLGDESTILLYKLPDPVKPGKISGRVVDEKGESLPGASVRIIQAGRSATTDTDGGYILTADPGTYTLEISYIGYQKKQVTGVVVKEGQNTSLTITIKPSSESLKGVVVTANYKKASTEGLLTRQKNAAELSNGMSADQIARTPDRNIGETLKRISGVSTVDNKFVVVRGIGERYNVATLDGTVLPSTESQRRNFSFEMIPSSLVDNVVVSKTITPDMNASFGGGMIQINTKDIPAENFFNFTVGTAYNDKSTGKDFVSPKRGKYDFLGFDDGRRAFPKNLQHTNRTTAPNTTLSEEAYQKMVDDQSRLFTNDNFSLYKYKALPHQNYQFSLGQLISLDTLHQDKLGITGALSYRNVQNITEFNDLHRGKWHLKYNNSGELYDYNVTVGALLNAGLQLGKNRFSFRNTYTHLFDNTIFRTRGFIEDDSDNLLRDAPSRTRTTSDPMYINLLQNKISGQHQLHKVKIEWDAARTAIDRQEKDITTTLTSPILVDGEYILVNGAGRNSEPEVTPMSRQNYENKETHYSWNLAASVPFEIGELHNSVKSGYFGNHKKANFNWTIAPFTSSSNLLADSLRYISIIDMQKPENIGKNGYGYSITPWGIDNYAGKSENQAGYIMLDNRFREKLRLVWGLRAEYYKYTEINNGKSVKDAETFTNKQDKRWVWLPSANLTYNPIANINLRAAFSKTVIRPEMMDNSRFFRYDPALDAMTSSAGLYSTGIKSYDVKAEWFPGLGEILSVGGFYKDFDKPIELTEGVSTNIYYVLKNAEKSKVYGFEFELRKSLSFLGEQQWLADFGLLGNLTLQKSKVRSLFLEAGTNREILSKMERPMYGQTPYLINTGIQYTGKKLGVNLLYNKSGYKTYIVSSNPGLMEYEMPRSQFDAQIGYKLVQSKLEIKLNAGNVFNKRSAFYRNDGSYQQKANFDPNNFPNGYENSDRFELKPGFSEKYDEGDLRTITRSFGRTFSTTITYNF